MAQETTGSITGAIVDFAGTRGARGVTVTVTGPQGAKTMAVTEASG